MKPITTETWQSFKFLANLKANPTKKALAYVVSSVDYDKDKYNHNIWIYQKNRHFQLTACDKQTSYTWLDDETIMFVANRNKDKEDTAKSDVYTISIYGGEAKKSFTIPNKVTNIEALSNLDFLITCIDDVRYPDFYKATEQDKEKNVKELKDNDFVQEINQIPFYSNGGTFTSNKRTRLYRYDKEKDKLVPLTTLDMNVHGFELNKDKSTALIIGEKFEDVLDLNNDVYHLDLKSNRIKKLTRSTQSIYKAFEINNEIIGVVQEIDGAFGLNQNAIIQKYNPKGRKFEKIVNPIYSIGNSINSDIRYMSSSLIENIFEQLYVTLNVNDHSTLVKLVDDELETLLSFNGSIDGFAMIADQLIVVGLKDQHPQELYTLDGKQLTHHNDVANELEVIKPEEIHYEVNERKLKGWVMLPPKFSSKKKYPAVLNIHGGPKTVYGSVYVHEMQVWAHAGYVVMFTNPTGSDGQDNAFSDIRGKYGTIDYDDLMGFVDVVLDKYPNIDFKKLGVTGGSYGGFMTNWIIGHTDRFACAITQRSISNWTSMYGVSDIGYFFTIDQQQATIQKPMDIEKLWWHSPIKYLPKMNTPTLIVHSEKDYRCPVEQGYQLFTGLKEKKVDVKMVMFHHENHDLSRSGNPKARQKRLDEMLSWFNNYLQ